MLVPPLAIGTGDPGGPSPAPVGILLMARILEPIGMEVDTPSFSEAFLAKHKSYCQLVE